MNLLEKYVEAMNLRDADKMADLFCEDAVFDDGAYAKLSGKPAYFEGRERIRQVFEGLFQKKTEGKIINISNDGKTMDYDVIVDENILPCTGVLKEENGRFKYYKCFTRE